MLNASQRGLNALHTIVTLWSFFSVIATVNYTKARLEQNMVESWPLSLPQPLVYLVRDQMHLPQVRPQLLSPFKLDSSTVVLSSDSDPSSTQTSRRNPKKKSTFQDILPPDLITTSSLSAESPTKTTPTREKIVKIVHNLRRSVTSIRDKRRIATSDPADELKHSKSSQAGSDIRRSATVATSRPHSKHPPS